MDRINEDVDFSFEFAIRYSDPDGNAPKNGYPRLLLDLDGDGAFDGGDDLNLTMDKRDYRQNDYHVGVDFNRVWKFEDPGIYSYGFFVINSINETSFIGPFDGPVVEPKEKGDETIPAGLVWAVAIICSICFLAIGIGIGSRSRKRDNRISRNAQRKTRKRT